MKKQKKHRSQKYVIEILQKKKLSLNLFGFWYIFLFVMFSLTFVAICYGCATGQSFPF